MPAPVKGLLAAALVALALLGAVARPAAAGTPCWKLLLTDWYDGRIDHTYPISCYSQALRHLPSDIQEYSSAHDDIERALLSAKRIDRHNGVDVRPSTPVKPNGTKRPASSSHVTTGGTPLPPGTISLPGNKPHSGIESLADQLNPASPSALPVPLLVLGGLAIVLVAAGGVGAVVRRRTGRS